MKRRAVTVVATVALFPVVSGLIATVTAVTPAAASAQVLAEPPTTLTLAETAQLVKHAIRKDMTINTRRRYTRDCTRRSRLRYLCRVRWSDQYGTLYLGTVEIWRTGSLGDDREHFRVVARGDRNDAPTQRFAGEFIEPTRRTTIGRQLTLIDQDGRVRVVAGALIDPIITSEYEVPTPGTRYVGVPLALTNLGTGRFDDSLRNGSKLITVDGHTIDAAIVVNGDCTQGEADIPAGETRLACVAFEVPFDVVVRTFEYSPSSGHAPETGEWALTA